MKRTVEATQILHSVLHPITPERDIRHNEEEKYIVYSPDGGTSEISERVGVTHLVQCWTMQGHKVGACLTYLASCIRLSFSVERTVHALQ